MDKCLVYYTIGYNIEFLDILELSIKTLRLFEPTIDVLILCDKSMESECMKRLGTNIFIKTFDDSKKPQKASMHKLNVFDYEFINNYNKVLFIDSDIIIHTKLDSIFTNIHNPNLLYVYTENIFHSSHKSMYWSLKNYSSSTLFFFALKHIFVFNAGCFGFYVSDIMKNHFNNINEMIARYSDEYFYEQSFMNVYFNKNNNTDRTVITNKNYTMTVKPNENYQGKIVHFAGYPGDAKLKIALMLEYYHKFIESHNKNLLFTNLNSK